MDSKWDMRGEESHFWGSPEGLRPGLLRTRQEAVGIKRAPELCSSLRRALVFSYCFSKCELKRTTWFQSGHLS